MGIRYYAYAFDAEQTQAALADPHSILSGDPLADAWGLLPGAAVSHATFEQVPPERDMLYLDKAWRELQGLTRAVDGEPPRPAYRMFEGDVRMHHLGWDAWVRVLVPDEIPAIAVDLARLSVDEPGDDYVIAYLTQARQFVQLLAEEGRGMVYMIG